MIELQKHMNELTEALTMYMEFAKAYVLQAIERSQNEEAVSQKQQNK